MVGAGGGGERGGIQVEAEARWLHGSSRKCHLCDQFVPHHCASPPHIMDVLGVQVALEWK